MDGNGHAGHGRNRPGGCVEMLARILLLTVLLLAGSACHRPAGPEERVRALVLAVQKAAERKDINSVLSAVSREYRDEQGNDREALKSMILYQFFQHQEIKVLITDLDVSGKDRSAAASFQAVLAGRSADSSVLPESLDAFRFQVDFAETGEGWKAVSARWQRSVEPPGTP